MRNDKNDFYSVKKNDETLHSSYHSSVFPGKHFYLLLLLIVSFILFKIKFLSLPYFWDEAWPYSSAIHSLYNNGLSILPDAILPEVSRGHPLLFHFLAATWMNLFGTSVTTMHLFPLLISVILLFVVWFFCREFFSVQAATIACLLIMVQPVFLAQSGLLLPEMLVALFSLAALHAYLKGRKWLYIFFASLLLLTKETGVVLPVSVFIFWCISYFLHGQKENKKGFFIRSLWILSPLLVTIIHFLALKKMYGWYVLPDYAVFITFNLTSVADRLTTIVVYIFVYYGRIAYFAVAFLAGTFILLRKKNAWKKNPARFLLVIFSISYLLFGAVNMYSPRYYITFLIVLLILFSDLIFSLLHSNKSFLNIVIVLLAGISMHYNTLKKSVVDHNLNYADGVQVNIDVVNFCEQNNWYEKKIHTHFLMMKSLTDPSCGYLKHNKKFQFIYDDYPEEIEVYIESGIEPDKRFEGMKNTRRLSLVKRFQINNAWAEIYSIPH